MVVNGQLAAHSPADELLERLDDPTVAASLSVVLEHADLLAVLVVALDGFLRRGDTIMEGVADGVRDLRQASGPGVSSLSGIDVQGLMSSATTLSGGVVAATPTLHALLTSTLVTDPRAAKAIALLGDAVVEGADAASAIKAGPTGVFGLLRVLKDENVSRGLNLLIEIVRSLGRRLA
ncbi:MULTISPECIES: DUF1641 domain-containing protein [Pseudonocardia]|uniref:DUF1641 domain-containing protein n=1 Tax=Pseudonocardia TaxID=1847 RepID=UPI000A286A75|nr:MULTISPECIES: DUF1641 domain-containing protein [Pseudonocardia]